MSNVDIIFNQLPGKGGDIGEIILNRPQVLNALSLEMFDSMLIQLEDWQINPKIKAVLIKSNCEAAFCAGGDIKKIYQYKGLFNANERSDFFWSEYRLNAFIQHFSKPYIAFLHGVTMGGGLGISMHGSHRVATETLKFAMPETAIGFYPDIGAAHFLAKLPHKIGYYLGLTGLSIDSSTAYDLGLMTQTVATDALANLQQVLLDTEFPDNGFATVSELINDFHELFGESSLTAVQMIIEDCFAKDTVEAIMSALQAAQHPFAKSCLDTLSKRSPTALKVTLSRLQRAEFQSFDEIIKTDYMLSKHFLETPDFFEGVRSQVIDKDKNPHWQPARLADVSPDWVRHYFEAKGEPLAIDFTEKS